MERGVDRRELVRATARSILNLLRNGQRLKRVRQRVQEDRERAEHVSTELLLASDPSVGGECIGPDALDTSATAIARHEVGRREPRSSAHPLQLGVPELPHTALDITPHISNVTARPHGFGGLSDIYQGLYKSGNHSTKVAIKVIRATAAIGETILKRHRQEVAVWREINHANLLPMFGLYSGIGVLPAMVSPWCDNGDIKTYLKTKEGSSTFDAVRLLLLVHVLQGLQYLHGYNPVIVHGDLKGANILVSDDGIACLCDFGFAKVLAEVSASLTSQSTLKGTLRWMAPELFAEEDARHTIWSDIWAFGCVLHEIFSGVVPYHRLRTEQGVIIALSQRQVPDIPENVPESVHAIITSCWALHPSSRIDIQRLLSNIHKLAASEVAALLVRQGMSSTSYHSLLEDHIDLLQTWNRSSKSSELYRIGDSVGTSNHLCNTLNFCIEHSTLLPLDRVVDTVRTMLDAINEPYDTTLRRSAQELKRFASLLGQADASLAVQFLRRFSTPMITTLPCHSNVVSRVVWTPCGSRLLSSSYDGTIRMWDPDQRIEVFSRKQARAVLVDSVAISSDSRFIAAASADYGLRVWDNATGISYDRELPGDKILWLSFARQDRCIMTATGAALLSWELESYSGFLDLNPILSPNGERGDLVVDSEFMALACSDDGTYAAYSLSSAVGLWVHSFNRDITWRLSDTHKPTNIAWSPDMQLLVCFSAGTGAFHVLETYNHDGAPRLFMISEQRSGVTSVAFSPDNRYVAAGSVDNSLRIWNVMLGHCTRVLEHPSLLKGVSSISYSPDGRYIAAGSYDGTVRVWDVDDRVWLRYDRHELIVPYSPCSDATAQWDTERAFVRSTRQNGVAADSEQPGALSSERRDVQVMCPTLQVL
ncbi:kinase-like protein [Exidia glandulosa HHB12029]|uniref:Kinase-like protein n=1 Tax=Exidia glandulosa HHB12029 TaxID=1314781 RepID=A0A166A4N3_EXIGL|nr:kinase-like protein [Exidia glandulosa HHB12029]